jgi:hypothetical protein
MVATLLEKLDTLIGLHRRNEDMWVDFFESGREKILKDPAFGCEYLIMAWHGIGGYDDERIFKNDEDEILRKAIHPEIYKLAVEIKNDQNKAA